MVFKNLKKFWKWLNQETPSKTRGIKGLTISDNSFTMRNINGSINGGEFTKNKISFTASGEGKIEYGEEITLLYWKDAESLQVNFKIKVKGNTVHLIGYARASNGNLFIYTPILKNRFNVEKISVKKLNMSNVILI